MWTSQIPLFSMAPALNKNSPYKKFFKAAVKKLLENGQFDIYKQRYTNTKKSCNSSRKGKPLGLFRLSTLFMMLSLSITLSYLILICEFVNRPQKFNENKMKNLVKKHCVGCIGKKQSVSHFCEDCMQVLCNICYEAHKRVLITRYHIIHVLDK